MSTEEKLKEIFQVVLSLPAGTDVRSASPGTVPAWDSLAHSMLIAAIESEFRIQIDPTESLDLTSYHAATALLAARDL